MRFIGVCGGREFADVGLVRRVLAQATEPGDVIVHGDARGADKTAETWAKTLGRRHIVRVPALWDVHGKAAGVIRNAVIAALPLAKLIAFPGGVGTADMVAKAKAAGIPVVEVSI